MRRKIESLARRFMADSSNLGNMEHLQKALSIAKRMPFPVNLWSVQNDIYALGASVCARTRKKAARGEGHAQEWMAGYLQLCELLAIRAA